MKTLVILMVAATLGLVACSKHKHEGKHGSAHDHMAAEMAAKGSDGVGEALVSVPAEGKEFKPPIQASQLPDGVWYCDMGTVEYARKDKGDGRCPICKMRLKEKVAEEK